MVDKDREDWTDEDKILFLSLEQQYVFLAFLQACMKSGWYKDTVPPTSERTINRLHNILLESLVDNGVLEILEEGELE